jgi:hypothetical protein
MHEACGMFFVQPEFIVIDLYNYSAQPQRSYHRLDHFKEVVGRCQGREGTQISPATLHQVTLELPTVSEVTATDATHVKQNRIKIIMKTFWKLNLTK